MPEIYIDGVILEFHGDTRDPVANKRRNITPQQLSRTSASLKKRVIDKFSRNINYRRLIRVNYTSIKLEVLETVNQKLKVGARKLAKVWFNGVERAKKTIMSTTQNAVWGVTIHLMKRFWTRQEMFRRRRFKGIEYTDTMIVGVKSVSGDRVSMVYVI